MNNNINNKITIESSIKTSDIDKILNRIGYIDSILYDEKYAQEQPEAELSRIKKFPETFMLIKDADEIVGCVEWYPITNSLKKRIRKSEIMIDTEITGDEIGWPEKHSEINIFILSVVVLKEYQGNAYGKKMFDKIAIRLNEKMEEMNYKPGNIYGYAVSRSGEAFLKHLKMKEVKELEDSKLFIGDLISSVSLDPAK